MSYTAPNRLLMPMRHSIDTLTDSWLLASAGPGNGAWPTANLAIYVPLAIPQRVVVRALWFANFTTSTGNVDMALYDESGVAIVSATAAAKTGSGEEQVFDVTDTTVGPGRYYVGLSSDSSSDTFVRYSLTAPIPLAFGVLSETSAYPLPSTATWTANQTLAFVPVVGVLLGTHVT